MKKIIPTLLLTVTTLTHAQSTLGRLCEDIPINSSVRVLVQPNRNNPLGQKYSLRRSGEREYEVYVNIDFNAAANYDVNLQTKEALNNHYKRFMRQCFRTNENRLVDEYQRKIKLKVYEAGSSPIDAAPPEVKIDIVGGNFRSVSNAYSKNIDCPSAIHEVLHIAGLSDEYEETHIGYRNNVHNNGRPAFDCRSVGPRSSIMRDMYFIGYGQNIYSGHVNMIIYPNCQRNNQRYMSCAKFAYETSATNRSSGLPIFDCATKVPDHCRDENWVRIAE
jgi:hypothetical protein